MLNFNNQAGSNKQVLREELLWNFNNLETLLFSNKQTYQYVFIRQTIAEIGHIFKKIISLKSINST